MNCIYAYIEILYIHNYMTTTFFDLPIELRENIWRKIRFKLALNNIRQNLKIQTPKIITNRVREIDVIFIVFQITSTKTMTIENALYKNENDTLIVDIRDSNYVRVLLVVLHDEKIGLYFSKDYNKRSFNYRKLNENSGVYSLYKNNELYQCKWL